MAYPTQGPERLSRGFFALDDFAVTKDQYHDPHAVLRIHVESRAVAEFASDINRPEWMDAAACLGSGLDFFPQRGESTRDQKATCRGCDVRPQCLEYALTEGLKHGIWGGTSERERRRLRRERAAS